MDPANRRRLRDFRDLIKGLESHFAGQVNLLESTDDISIFRLAIKPKDGYFKGGTFIFAFKLINYPEKAPEVVCLTKIYHPNIDTAEIEEPPDNLESYDDMSGNVCLNLLSNEWTTDYTLLDVVQGIMFLLHNPNFVDPLSPYFNDINIEPEEYAHAVLASLLGEEFDGWITFDRNYDESMFEDENIYDVEAKMVCSSVLNALVDHLYISELELTDASESENKTEGDELETITDVNENRTDANGTENRTDETENRTDVIENRTEINETENRTDVNENRTEINETENRTGVDETENRTEVNENEKRTEVHENENRTEGNESGALGETNADVNENHTDTNDDKEFYSCTTREDDFSTSEEQAITCVPRTLREMCEYAVRTVQKTEKFTRHPVAMGRTVCDIL